MKMINIFKNYAFQSVSDKRKTHEDTLGVTRADFVGRRTAFNEKTPLFSFGEVGVFPNFPNEKLLLKAYNISFNCKFSKLLG